MKKSIILASVACIMLVAAMFISLSRPADTLPPVSVASSAVPTEEMQSSASAVAALLQEPDKSIEPNQQEMDFGSINGVSLTDGKEQIVTELGLPLEAAKDELLDSHTTWTYPDMNIAFTGNDVDYVSVSSSNPTVQVGGERLPVSLEGWISRYGEPEFKAEDGVGYVDANGFAAKLFLDEHTGKLVSVDFFWANME